MVTIKDRVQIDYGNSVLKSKKQLYTLVFSNTSQVVNPTYKQIGYHLSQGFNDAINNTVRQIKGIRANKSKEVLIKKLSLINEAIHELNDPFEVFDYPLLGTPVQDIYINEIARMITNVEVSIEEMVKFYGINYLNGAKKVVDTCNFLKTDAGLYLLNPV